MCSPFSCIVKSDLTLLVSDNIAVHSHSEILRRAGLPPETSINQYAKVEITPKDNAWLSDVSEWELKLDEEREPEWWRENLPEIDARVRDAAAKWQRKLAALTEWHVHDGEHLIVIAQQITLKMSGGDAWSYGTSQMTITELSGGGAWSYDQSQMTITEMSGGYARSFDRSQMTITEMSGGYARSGDRAQMTITEMSGGDARSFGGTLNIVNDRRKGN